MPRCLPGSLKRIIIDDDLNVLKAGTNDEIKNNIGFIVNHNTRGIFQYVVQNFPIPCSHLLQLINKINNKNSSIYIKLVFDILFYNNFTDEQYGKIISKAVSKNIWDVADYLHMLGYKTNDLQLLLREYPDDRFRDLQYYGYDLTEQILIYKIKGCKNINIDDLTAPIIKKVRLHIINNFKYDQLKRLHEKKLIELNEIDMITACENLNISGLLYFIENDFKINNRMIDVLFCIKGTVSRVKGKRVPYRGRYFRIKIFNTNKISDDYEDNMVKLLDRLYENNQKIPIKNIVWRFLFSHRYIRLIDKLCVLGFKPIINLYAISSDLRGAILEDNLTIIKKYIELNLVRPDRLSKNSKLFDIAILNKSEKVSDFLMNDLKMKCSKSILSDYTNKLTCRRYIKIELIDLVRLLESIDFPIKDSVLTYACQLGNKQVIEYMIENKKRKPTSKQLEYLLLQRKYKLVPYMLERGAKINKNNLIDRLLNHSIDNFQLPSSYNLIKYVHKKYNATASKRSVDYCFKLRSYKILDYLVNEFNLTCEHISDAYDRLFHRRRRRWDLHEIKRGDDIKFIKYIIDNSEKLKITLTNEVKSIIVYNAIGSCKEGILEYLVNKFDYKLKIQDVHDILEHCNIDGLRIIMKQGIEITEELINELISYSNLPFIRTLHREYKIDIKKFVNLKQLHMHIVSFHLYGDILHFLIDEIGIGVTPYTLELYSNVQTSLFRSGIIIFLINKLNKRITQESKDRLLALAQGTSRYSKDLTNIIKQCEIIKYEPNPNEVVEVRNILHDDIGGEMIDDFELDPIDNDDIIDIFDDPGYDNNRFLVVRNIN